MRIPTYTHRLKLHLYHRYHRNQIQDIVHRYMQLQLIEILFKVSDDRVFIIDEIDRCLHPSMTVKVIELFLSMAKKRNTQLIITSHESRLIASEMLRNDEICFVCKTAKGESIINPLEKYQLRADKKVYAALFDGTLDAGPSFDEAKLSRLSE